jgi:acetaldehyde dehydrogenase
VQHRLRSSLEPLECVNDRLSSVNLSNFDHPLFIPETGKFSGTRITVLFEVAGAADYLPAYAGNLDIMTSAAKATAERIAWYETQIAGART